MHSNGPTRRDLLRNGVRAAKALCACYAGPAFGMPHQQASAPAATSHAPDEMTANTLQQQHYPPPDFGPLPASLPPETKAVSGKGSLRAHGKQHGVVAGAAVVVRGLQNDPVLQQLVAEQYSILVPEAELKWVALRPSQDAFDFSLSDQLFQFAARHGIQVRGHTFVWHNSVPKWLEKDSPHLDVRQLLVDHIRTVAGRYKGKVHSWDVVNEAILPKDGQKDGLRNSFWYQHVGHDYIDLAFRTAREADPQAKLTYNDYGVEHDSDEEAERRRYILALLRGMKERGVPLDAVGVQSHIKAESPYPIDKGFTEYLRAIQEMGLEVYLTELDVNEDDIRSDDIKVRDSKVAETYRQFLDVALASPATKLVLTWGVSDRRTWLNDGPTHHRKQPDRPQRSLPFDPAYKPAPAFFAIRESFNARTTNDVGSKLVSAYDNVSS